MSVYPFIEAEKVAERNVASACALMEVSWASPGEHGCDDVGAQPHIAATIGRSRV